MTAPEGEAFIEFHADTDQVEPEARRGIKKAAEDIEKSDLPEVGDRWGKSTSKSMGDRLEREGPSIGARLKNALSKLKITKKIDLDVDRDFMENSLERAVAGATGPGGPLSKLGQAVFDAVGAGFNVSGRSPLIAFLIPLIGAIVGLVVAALQAVNALVAALATVPLLIGAIGAQAAVLMIAFNGVGEAFKNAFAAKNAKELEKALEGLTPAAQNFIREILPFKKFLSDSGKLIQEMFFEPLQGRIPELFMSVGQQIRDGLGNIALDLGGFFSDLLAGLASPTAQNFFIQLFDSTRDFLEVQGPKIIEFLGSIAKLTTFARPLLDDIGSMLGGNLEHLAHIFDEIAESGEFQNFLHDMSDTLASVVELLFKATTFVAAFLAQLNNSGGKDVIDAFADAFEQLTFFISSPVGQKAMEGLVHTVIILIQASTGLLEIIFGILAAFEFLGEVVTNTIIPSTIEGFQRVIAYFGTNFIPNLRSFFVMVGDAIRGYFQALGQTIINYVNGAGNAIRSFFVAIGDFIIGVVTAIGNWFANLWRSITSGGQTVLVGWFRSLPGTILGIVGGFGSLLVQAGRNLISGLIQGVRDMIPSLSSVISGAVAAIRRFLPFSPAKEGPLSGAGDPYRSGQEIVNRLGEGMHMGIPSLRDTTSQVANNITFGMGAIVQNFQGLPTQTQAAGIGRAVGNGINTELANRDTRLAVRTL